MPMQMACDSQLAARLTLIDLRKPMSDCQRHRIREGCGWSGEKPGTIRTKNSSRNTGPEPLIVKTEGLLAGASSGRFGGDGQVIRHDFAAVDSVFTAAAIGSISDYWPPCCSSRRIQSFARQGSLWHMTRRIRRESRIPARAGFVKIATQSPNWHCSLRPRFPIVDSDTDRISVFAQIGITVGEPDPNSSLPP